MDAARRVAWLGMTAGGLASAAGVLVLLGYILARMVTVPGTSFEDAYHLGLLPWIPIAFWLMLGGLTTLGAAGVARTWLTGPWLARLAVLLPAGAAAFWWWYALLPPRRAVPCNPGECPPPGPPDPVAVAYSIPETAILYLVLPTVAIVVIAVLAEGRRRAQQRPTAVS